MKWGQYLSSIRERTGILQEGDEEVKLDKKENSALTVGPNSLLGGRCVPGSLVGVS